MSPNIEEFISYHNANILDEELTADFETIATFAARKNIALAELSIEKHRLPFINWITSLSTSKI